MKNKKSNKVDRAVHYFVFSRFIKKELLNIMIDKQKRNLQPMIGVDLGNGEDKTVIECPLCKERGKHGTLEKLTENEKNKLKEREGFDSYPDEIYGCDECRFWCDAEKIENR